MILRSKCIPGIISRRKSTATNRHALLSQSLSHIRNPGCHPSGSYRSGAVLSPAGARNINIFYVSILAYMQKKIHHIITISCITSALFPVPAASETAFTACKQGFLQSAGRGFQMQLLLCIDRTQHLPSLSHNVYKKMCSCAKPHKYGLPGFLHEILHQFYIKSLIFLVFCCLSCIYSYLILHSSCITPGVIQSIFSIHKKRSDHRIPPDTECSLRP